MTNRRPYLLLVAALVWTLGAVYWVRVVLPDTNLPRRARELHRVLNPDVAAARTAAAADRTRTRARGHDPFDGTVREAAMFRDWPPASEAPPEAYTALWRSTAARVNAALAPTSLRLVDGETVHCEILQEHPTHYIAKQSFGHSGFAKRRIHKDDITAMVDRRDLAPCVNAAEAFMAAELPSYEIYQNATETFITDTDYFAIERYDAMVDALFARIRKRFPELVTDTPVIANPPARMLTLAFHSTAEYGEFFRRHFGEHTPPTAFYWPVMHTLVIFNDSEDGTFSRADRAAAFRHEASHYFFHHYVMGEAVPYAWFNEGLAEYCAAERLGQADLRHVKLLEAAIDYESLPDRSVFMNDVGRFSAGTALEMNVNYALAWACVFTAVKRDYRELRGYLEAMREIELPLGEREHADLFAGHFGRRFEAYVDEALAYVSRY